MATAATAAVATAPNAERTPYMKFQTLAKQKYPVGKIMAKMVVDVDCIQIDMSNVLTFDVTVEKKKHTFHYMYFFVYTNDEKIAAMLPPMFIGKQGRNILELLEGFERRVSGVNWDAEAKDFQRCACQRVIVYAPNCDLLVELSNRVLLHFHWVIETVLANQNRNNQNQNQNQNGNGHAPAKPKPNIHVPTRFTRFEVGATYFFTDDAVQAPVSAPAPAPAPAPASIPAPVPVPVPVPEDKTKADKRLFESWDILMGRGPSADEFDETYDLLRWFEINVLDRVNLLLGTKLWPLLHLQLRHARDLVNLMDSYDTDLAVRFQILDRVYYALRFIMEMDKGKDGVEVPSLDAALLSVSLTTPATYAAVVANGSNGSNGSVEKENEKAASVA